ncbi:glycoside hydrolase family 88 protein [Chryseobacterium gotjawalense]|uniref:Glycoside hydrolase family 88 protein n=1 Tax=Chryseobacterium gotjawalense TaxID=3042315 RepID=A0ABY8RD59_9FLAO|nr:glycoside hydrolase family 88 protein [Chryseobacterium sp. wdc7]WHF51434.1 glycoside hydrolase family 88 protein [Chryseobacterium sp. wdc7]
MVWNLYFILILFLIIFLIDAISQFTTWQSRINIGRFQHLEDWRMKVLTLSRRWLKNTPTVPLTDNDRLIIIDMIKGKYKRSAIQCWQEAALVLGLTASIKKAPSHEIQKEINDFFVSKTETSGAWKIIPTESDHAMLAYAFLNAEFIDHQKYRAAFDQTYQMILSLKGTDGTVAYKNHVREYRFVDTIGFICPFLVSYGLKFNVPEAVDLAVNQITEYQKYGMMPQENIPCHTYHVATKIPAGLFGWGRGLGWYVIGLADTWHGLPENHPHKKKLEILVVATANSTIKFQSENGGFHWLLFDKGSHLDSSSAATLAWFFTVASEIPEIAEECLFAREKALDYLMTVTRRSGAVDFSQGDTKGIGVYSQNFDILPFTQGIVLRTLNYSPDAI